MKDNIHLFGESLKEELLGCRREESAIRAIEKQVSEKQKKIEEIKAQREKRISTINEIRLQKIAEIDGELKESEAQLEALKEEQKKLLYAYCKKNRHNFILIDARGLGIVEHHFFCQGSSYLVSKLCKCTVCGYTNSYSGESYGGDIEIKSYQQKIPEELYDDATLREDGKTLRTILKEIEQLEQYTSYLGSLYGKICELFGHDVEIFSYNPEHDTVSFICKCCKRILSCLEYNDAHNRAKYHGIVPHYYFHDFNGYVISLEKEKKLVPSLPTYKVYQKTLKEKK